MISNIIQIFLMVGWFLIILIPLIIIHEFGHLLMARLTRTKVVEYGIGMPPRWLKKKWKGIIWSLNYLPLGGFVRIYGDHDALDEASYRYKKSVPDAKENYINDRFSEILSNHELEFFLKENNLEYSKEWQELENYFNSKTDKNSEDRYINLIRQLKTLIEWEFETKLNSKEAFFNKKWWQQFLILIGGVAFNLIAAFIIFWLLFSFGGVGDKNIPIEQIQQLKNRPGITLEIKSESPRVASVRENFPAANIGMMPEDELVSFAGKNMSEIRSLEEFGSLVRENRDSEVEVVFRSNKTGELITTTTRMKEDNGRVLFGIGTLYYEGTYKADNLWSGAVFALETTNSYVFETFEVLGDIGRALLPQTQDRSALQMVIGPIGVSYFGIKIFDSAGIRGILELIAVVSISLAVFNILPLPALDGGRIIIAILNKVTGKRNKKLEGALITLTTFLLLWIGFHVAWQDIDRIIQMGG